MRELRSIGRGLAGSWKLSLTAILCLAAGTAAVSAMLTVVRGTLLRPLPFPDADRLVRIWRTEPEQERIELSYPLLRELTDSVGGLEALEATARVRLLFFGEGGGRRVEGEAVTPGYFELLGLRPAAGRLFDREEYEPGREGVMVLSHAAWGTLFGFDPGLAGREVRTDRGIFEVVGALPPGFTGTVEEDAGEIEFWMPIDHLSPSRLESWAVGGIWGLGRLARGVSAAGLEAELAAVAERLARAHPDTHGGRGLTVEALGENWRAGLRRGAYILSGAAAGLLLVAALNVAVLLLARELRRRRQGAVRRALGASRGRLVRDAFAETAVLVAAGGLLGGALAYLLLPWLMERATLTLPTYVSLRPDAAILAGVVVVLGLTAIVAAVAPASAAARVDPALTLREQGRSTGAVSLGRAWLALLVTEVALTTLLVFGSVTLLRSWQALHGEDLGFRTAGVLRIAVFLDPDAGDTGEVLRLQERAREVVASHPAVEEAGLIWLTVPIWGAVEETVRWPEMPEDLRDHGLRVGLFMADAGAFRVLEVERRAGRLFDEGESGRVAIVSASLASRLGGTEKTLGREVGLPDGPVRVVGIVEDVKFSGARETPADHYELYLPLAVSPQPGVTIVARTGGDPDALAVELARLVGDALPHAALDWIGSMDYWLGERYREARFAPLLLALFTTAALWIAGIGIFALLAGAVEGRRNEIGIRKALGATRGAVVRAVVIRGLVPVAIGVGAGAALAWLFARLLESFLYEVAPRDPLSFLLTAAAVVGSAVVAAWLPARRAARVDPMVALRED